MLILSVTLCTTNVKVSGILICKLPCLINLASTTMLLLKIVFFVLEFCLVLSSHTSRTFVEVRRCISGARKGGDVLKGCISNRSSFIDYENKQCIILDVSLLWSETPWPSTNSIQIKAGENKLDSTYLPYGLVKRFSPCFLIFFHYDELKNTGRTSRVTSDIDNKQPNRTTHFNTSMYREENVVWCT